MLIPSYGFLLFAREYLLTDPEGGLYLEMFMNRRGEFNADEVQSINGALEESLRRYLKDDCTRYTKYFWRNTK